MQNPARSINIFGTMDLSGRPVLSNKVNLAMTTALNQNYIITDSPFVVESAWGVGSEV